MSYDYYCMECGKQINQSSVLFDMAPILTSGSAVPFNILRFRMTEKELNNLLQKGVPAENGFNTCTLSFPELLAYIGNANNLHSGDPADNAIAGLTRNDIKEYLKSFDASVVQSKTKKSGNYLLGFDDDPFAEPSAESETDAVSEQPAEEAKPYEPSLAVLALEQKDTTNTDREQTRSLLGSDFSVLNTLFAESDLITIQLKKITEPDNEGVLVATGYEFKLKVGVAYAPSITRYNVRVCPQCGAPVFAHAGTAKHQAIAFVGYQSSGKTSTIVALAHYAENRLLNDFQNEIWAGADGIPSVASIEVLSKTEAFKRDLADFAEGFAPVKTQAANRVDAYSATFRIKSKGENKYHLLTLTDLPGELCNDDGTVQTDKIHASFPVALSCDAYITCFDTQSIDPNGEGVANWVLNTCKWAHAFQEMRRSQYQLPSFAPTMLLFTKCPDLENTEPPKGISRILLPIEQIYSFAAEKYLISQNQLYRFVCDQFNTLGQLSSAYHAMIRCSPMGYAALTREKYIRAKENGGTAYKQNPAPRHIEELMRWLLSVSGCIPTEAKYVVGTNPPVSVSYHISRPQLRHQNPQAGSELNEAMSRCALFENPGKFDKEVVGGWDTWANRTYVLARMKLHRNGNLG